jgi:DUF4097 and DUF4098 domain-containing protein YvlB
MNSLQKIIKYCAIAVAIALAIGIISFAANVFYGVATLGFGGRSRSGNVETIDFEESFERVTSLDIDNSTGELRIVKGDGFRVEASRVFKGFRAEVNSSGRLSISDNESGIHFFGFRFRGFNSPNSKITVYVPEDFVADEVRIDTGAGAVTIEELTTDYLYISAGAGNIKGSNISAEKVKFEGGVGSIHLEEVNFQNTDFDCGVGSVNIKGVLLGENKLECGVGEVVLDLEGNINDYDLDIESGVGTIRVNGQRMEDTSHTNRSADHSIEVDGGVGNVKIDIGQN